MNGGEAFMERTFVKFAALLAALFAGLASAQQYPVKPITMMVPYAPGPTDTVARIIAQAMTKPIGTSFVVENRPSNGGILAPELVAKATPDGYTLLVQSGTHVVLPFVEPRLRYDPLKDFAPVASLASTRYVMLVHPSVPAKTLKEFIAFAKARPGQINFASSGTASGSRIAGEVFNMLAGVRMQNIPYKGGAQALTDAIGVIKFSTKNSLLFPDLKRTLTLPLTGQGMNFQLVPLGLPTG